MRQILIILIKVFFKDTGLGTEGSVIWEELGAYDRNMLYDAFKELNFYKG